jgi:RNA-directed DNA polymerase
MSMHDRLPHYKPPRLALVLDPQWVVRHRGDRYDFLERHHRQARLVRRVGRQAFAKIAPSLRRRIADERTLRIGWDDLEQNGGQAPGPDGDRYEDFDDAGVWEQCRWLRDRIRAGEYRPTKERICWISKGPGRGRRPLVIQSIYDRVVQRAAVLIVQPFLDPLFDPYSFGFRPRRSRLHALALAERFFLEQKRCVWVTADVKDAFSRVPLHRLLDIVRKYLVAADVVRLIGKVITGSKVAGLRQGGCLSPLLLNLYLHHVLDRTWRKCHPDIPLIRYADDLFLLCRSVRQANDAYASLVDLLQPAGMLLKGDQNTAMRKLSAEQPVDWMGFRIEEVQGELAIWTVTLLSIRARHGSPSLGRVASSWTKAA